MVCNCKKDLVWGGDHSYDDYGLEGDGIVSNYSCYNNECSVETVIIYNKI